MTTVMNYGKVLTVGILSEVIAYKFGKRRGRIKAERNYTPVVINDKRNDECVNYDSFCRSFGSCNGMACEYE